MCMQRLANANWTRGLPQHVRAPQRRKKIPSSWGETIYLRHYH